MTTLFGSILMAGLLLGACGWAQQQAADYTNTVQVNEGGGLVNFDFHWMSPPGQQVIPPVEPLGPQQEELHFSLRSDDMARGDAEFDPYDNNAANAYALKVVQRAAIKESRPGLEIGVVPTANGFEIEGKGTRGTLSSAVMQQVQADLQKVRDGAVKDYVHDHFYMLVDGTHIMPDHKRIAVRYAPAMAPVTAAVRQATNGLDERGTINYLMGFLQSIPYDELLDRNTSNGAGFQTPYGLLRFNRGDCDTKAVALAALLRNLYPGLPLTMVYVPDHAFIGVGMPQAPTDYALRLGGRVFVLADATGPRRLVLGQVAPTALTALNSGTFSFQEIP